MSKIYQGAVELIGNTPLVEVINLEKEQELKARVLVKLEYLNPAGSFPLFSASSKSHAGRRREERKAA